MPCLLLLLALVSPRLALVAAWLLTTWLERAYDSFLVPLIGFFLLPWTTLAYAAMWVARPQGVQGAEWLLVLLAVLADLGVLAGGRRGRA